MTRQADSALIFNASQTSGDVHVQSVVQQCTNSNHDPRPKLLLACTLASVQTIQLHLTIVLGWPATACSVDHAFVLTT